MAGSEAVPGAECYTAQLCSAPGGCDPVLREPVPRLQGLHHATALPHLDPPQGHHEGQPGALRQCPGTTDKGTGRE